MPLFIMNSDDKYLAAAAHNESAKRQEQLALSLLVLWILTDNSDASFSLDNFALFANRFN